MSKISTPLIKVALADDHTLLRHALAQLIDSFGDCRVIQQCGTGRELTKNISSGVVPDVVLLDLSMPEMDGLETAAWLKKYAPQVHVLMLTMYDSEFTRIRLLKAGVKGFLKKDIHPAELKFAIHSVVRSGYYYSDHSTGMLIDLFKKNPDDDMSLQKATLTERELQFLKLVCSDLTYREIARQMNMSTRSVDTLRDHLFKKLDVNSRVGLAMMAIKQGLMTF